ncbi:hypothetical protein OK016_26175 [Vibrio chagasii]|nr:hypothetical protein [Vibrio chagasii]
MQSVSLSTVMLGQAFHSSHMGFRHTIKSMQRDSYDSGDCTTACSSSSYDQYPTPREDKDGAKLGS